MGLSDFVPITITVDSTGISRAGFGTALILSHNASWVERTRTYTGIAGVAADFAVGSPEYRAASALFSQTPHPTKVKVGRGNTGDKPTLQYTLSVANVKNSHAYVLKVKGATIDDTTITSTSDGSATDGEIVADIVSKLNAISGKNFTAAGSTSPLTVTGNAAGDWFSIEVVDRTDLAAAMTHGDANVDDSLTAIQLEDSDWYELITLYNSSDYVLTASSWVEAQTKRYRACSADTKALTTVVTTDTDTIDKLKTTGRKRTMACYHPAPDQFFEAAWAGRILAADPGTIVEALKTLSGVAVVSMTDTERANLTAKRGNSYEAAGADVTFNGTVPAAGWYFDTVRDRDALSDDVQKSVMEALAGTDKVEYSDEGASVIAAAVRGSLQRNTSTPSQKRILAATPAPQVKVPKVADVSAADKANRLLPDVTFSGTLGGGIQKVPVAGVVSI